MVLVWHYLALQALSLSKINTRTYALVVSNSDNAMQIIDITHPQLPFPVSTVQIDGSTYALVASNKDHGFTILNMDNPESPSIVFNTTSTHANYSAIS